jgi:hypothetical protein
MMFFVNSVMCSPEQVRENISAASLQVPWQLSQSTVVADLADIQQQAGGAVPLPPGYDLKQSSGDTGGVRRDIHQVSSQAEAVHARP